MPRFLPTCWSGCVPCARRTVKSGSSIRSPPHTVQCSASGLTWRARRAGDRGCALRAAFSFRQQAICSTATASPTRSWCRSTIPTVGFGACAASRDGETACPRGYPLERRRRAEATECLMFGAGYCADGKGRACAGRHPHRHQWRCRPSCDDGRPSGTYEQCGKVRTLPSHTAVKGQSSYLHSSFFIMKGYR